MTEKTDHQRIALTGFMGVGKSTVSRHVSRIVRRRWVDLDTEIERSENRSIAQIVDNDGINVFREIEFKILADILENQENLIISLGGGAFTTAANRESLSRSQVTTIWLGAPFAHCWANIRTSYKERPLARNRIAAEELFEERERIYCLADWHFLIKPGCNSYAVASQIADQVFGESRT